jgi:hypothetical protein
MSLLTTDAMTTQSAIISSKYSCKKSRPQTGELPQVSKLIKMLKYVRVIVPWSCISSVNE